jgi:hypothetical protein
METQKLIIEKTREVLALLEGCQYCDATDILDKAKFHLQYNAVIKISPLADEFLPSDAHIVNEIQS